MYELSNKEIRAEFKKTEYGKKTNKWLYLSVSIAIVFVVLEVVLFFLCESSTITMSIQPQRFLKISGVVQEKPMSVR